MSDSISTTTRYTVLHGGRKVLQSALGSSTREARKNLARKFGRKFSVAREDINPACTEEKPCQVERSEQTVSGVLSLSVGVEHLQQAANLIACTDQALGSLSAMFSAFLNKLDNKLDYSESTSKQTSLEQVIRLSTIFHHTLEATEFGGQKLLGKHAPALLREILLGVEVDPSFHEKYSNITHEVTEQLLRAESALNAFSGRLVQAEETLSADTLRKTFSDINAAVSHNRAVLSTLQEVLSATLRNMLADIKESAPDELAVTATSTYEALSDRTRSQLLNRTTPDTIHTEIAADVASSLLRD